MHRGKNRGSVGKALGTILVLTLLLGAAIAAFLIYQKRQGQGTASPPSTVRLTRVPADQAVSDIDGILSRNPAFFQHVKEHSRTMEGIARTADAVVGLRPALTQINGLRNKTVRLGAEIRAWDQIRQVSPQAAALDTALDILEGAMRRCERLLHLQARVNSESLEFLQAVESGRQNPTASSLSRLCTAAGSLKSTLQQIDSELAELQSALQRTQGELERVQQALASIRAPLISNIAQGMANAMSSPLAVVADTAGRFRGARAGMSQDVEVLAAVAGYPVGKEILPPHARYQSGQDHGHPRAPIGAAPVKSLLVADTFDQDMSGWQSGQQLGHYKQSDACFYSWDSGRQALSVRQPNKNVDGQDHYLCRRIDYDGGSFTFSFDLYVQTQAYDGSLNVGLSTDPNNAWDNKLDKGYWLINYGRSDGGKAFGSNLLAGTTQWNVGMQPYAAEGHWWHHVLKYDTASETATVTVSRGAGGSTDVVFQRSYRVPGGFPATMDFVVLSDNRSHGHPSTGSKAMGEGYLDNVKVEAGGSK